MQDANLCGTPLGPSAGPVVSPDRERRIWDTRDDALAGAELSTLYHRKRERFFAILDKWDKILTLLFGSAAFAGFFSMDKHPAIGVVFGVFALCALIFDFNEKARKHGELAVSFKLLERDIVQAGEFDYSEDQVNEWAGRRRYIESGEPATYTMLVRLCQNEIARASGKVQDVTPVAFYERWLAQLIPFSNSKFSTAPKTS